MLKQYQPGTHKLIHHLEHLQKIVNHQPVAPLHVSLWPNSKCQLNCPYCCGKNIKDRSNELNLEEFKDLMDVLVKYGTKAIEFSGVIGEPLLWKHLDAGVQYAFDRGLKLSLITNGLALSKTSPETLMLFSWIRVSLQSLAHAKMIKFNSIPTKISGSYIVHDERSFNALRSLDEFALENNIVIRVAVVRPCSLEWEDKVRTKVFNLSEKCFFAEKKLGTSNGCYMAWIRAGIDWNGNFLPCPSIELSHENQNTIPENFTLCHISQLEQWLLDNPPRDLGYRCKFCNCGKEENDFIYDLLQEVEDVDFV